MPRHRVGLGYASALSRVRQAYGVDLSLEVVYSGEFTVAELAKVIELKEGKGGGWGRWYRQFRYCRNPFDTTVRPCRRHLVMGGLIVHGGSDAPW